jgi:hypothetical protein
MLCIRIIWWTFPFACPSIISFDNSSLDNDQHHRKNKRNQDKFSHIGL